MTHIAAWQVGDDEVPRRIPADNEFLEKHLESWIETDPSLLAGDVRWASRQLTLTDGSRLDLLGLTRDGTWVIVELKPGPPYAGAVHQVMHYFTQIASMTNKELADRITRHGLSDETTAAALEELEPDGDDSTRDYLLVVGGVGSGEAATTTVNALARHGFDVPIRVVTFAVLRDSSGRRILVRDVEEPLFDDPGRHPLRSALDGVLELASRRGVGPGFEAVRSHLLARGFREHSKPTGLNFNTGSRLQCLWVRPAEGAIHMGYLSGNFPSLYQVDEGQAIADMGENWVDMAPDDALAQIREWARIIEGYKVTAEEGADTAG